MTVNRVLPNRLIFCPDCRGRNSWQHFPEKDMKYSGGQIFEFTYRCRSCGAIIFSPCESEVRG